jgi:hypothetical protein
MFLDYNKATQPVSPQGKETGDMDAKENGRKVKVGLVQINNSFSGQSYLPYSTGLLQAYVQKHAKVPDRYEFLTHIHSRIPVKQAVEHLLGADGVGF